MFIALNTIYIVLIVTKAQVWSALNLIYTILRVGMEGILLYLWSQHQANVRIQSSMTQGGDLVIIGINQSGKEIFSFYLRGDTEG